MATMEHLVELRGEVPREYVDVIDAVVQATPGASRMSVVRVILAEWVDRKVHEASLVYRLTNGNGSAPEPNRRRTGNAPEGKA